MNTLAAPPRICRYLGVTLACVMMTVGVCVAGAGGSTAVHRIESHAVAGNRMGISTLRTLFVYTPEGYADSRRLYPVIYWIPGWETPASNEYVGALGEAIADEWLGPVIVVTIDVREGVLMLNSPVFGNWADFLVEEVVPFIDGEYRTIASPKGRALMGHSTGGYAAMLLPLLYPGVWSAVGLNDASVWGACNWRALEPPADFSEYPSLEGQKQAWTQIGIATSPDMELPRLFSLPFDPGAGPEVRAAWASRCLTKVETLRTYRDALAQLSAIGIAVPVPGEWSNRSANLSMAEAMRKVGFLPQVHTVQGTHGSHRGERFIVLARIVTYVMPEPLFDLSQSEAVAWGAMKRRQWRAAAPAADPPR